jgi:hypothetical protein
MLILIPTFTTQPTNATATISINSLLKDLGVMRPSVKVGIEWSIVDENSYFDFYQS